VHIRIRVSDLVAAVLCYFALSSLAAGLSGH